MKNFIKSLLFIFIIISFIFIPRNVFATSSSDFIPINSVIDSYKTDVDGITINNIKFYDNSKSSDSYFCINGNFVKSSKIDKNYHYIVRTSYYDSNYNLLITGIDNDNDSILNDQVKGSCSVSSISYFKMEVSILDDKEYRSSIDYKNYYYNTYDVNIKVNDNYTYEVNEKFNCHFNSKNSHIIRNIPISGNYTKIDGSKGTYKGSVSNIDVLDGYSKKGSKSSVRITFKDKDIPNVGDKYYTYSYLYGVSYDDKNNDYLLVNLIDKTNTYISNITFNINMPKEIESNYIKFSGLNNNDIEYKVVGNSIIGKIKRTMNPNEKVSLRMDLPKGYFLSNKLDLVNTKKAEDKKEEEKKVIADLNGYKSLYVFLAIVYKAIGLYVVVYLWKKYGKKRTLVKSVEFYPPEGMDCLEMALKYRGKVRSKDVITLLITLSNKGYIKISEAKDGTLDISKVKEYDGNIEVEKIFYDGLFEKWVEVNDSYRRIYNEGSLNEVNSKDVFKHLYLTIQDIMLKLNREVNTDVITSNISKVSKQFSIYTCFNTLFLMTAEFTVLATKGKNFSYLIDVSLFMISGIVYVISILKNKELDKNIVKLLLVYGLINIFIGGSFIINKNIFNAYILFAAIINICCDIVSFYIYSVFETRNDYGLYIQDKIEGFKDFLSVCEKHRLDTLMKEDSKYFYKILPYTFVLDIDDLWIKKYDNLVYLVPDCYICNNGGGMDDFMFSLSNNLDNVSKEIDNKEIDNKQSNSK